MAGNDISYHNKDILMKFLSECYKDKGLEAYGLKDFPRIKELMPNEFSRIRADQRRSDTLFEMEDGSILMLEYESNARFLENHLKYMDYANQIMYRYYNKNKELPDIRIVVIYTSEVMNPIEEIDVCSIRLNSKAVLLSEYNGDAILQKVIRKMEEGKSLTDEEIMKLILVPLMHSREKRQILIEKTIEVAKCISDEQEQIQVIAGILVATDKFIDEDYAKKVKEWLRMTKVGRLYEQEKQEEIDKALSAAGMLFKGMSIEEVAKKLDVTIEKVKEWEKRLSH
ncbi:transcriptional regulator [Bacillus toyonensis]|uniref:transcriptional regulator n=1 Tax=Bacillus toyonensis TaxID=155322 RepID=UPI00112417C2|nr:transcriptional regulator [Bacillus toyonensis]MCA1044052.1 transcriptional regulator [Bacillus toyonensis]MDO8158907.1 transcriptional regulator [Bacillus toyonensis]MED3197284.1 transcriptional regulator [Bacillus toyonensis]